MSSSGWWSAGAATDKLQQLQLEQAVTAGTKFQQFSGTRVVRVAPFELAMGPDGSQAYYGRYGARDARELILDTRVSHGLQADDTPLTMLASAGVAGLLKLGAGGTLSQALRAAHADFAIDMTLNLLAEAVSQRLGATAGALTPWGVAVATILTRKVVLNPKFQQAVKDAWEMRPGKTWCFPAGTLVQAKGGPRPIESVRPGDAVWGYDHRSKEWLLQRVAETFRHQYEGQVVALTVAGETIEATANHPFWVEQGEALEQRPACDEGSAPSSRPVGRGRWVAAGQLRVGDVLLLRPDRLEAVTGLASRWEALTVYNLEVEGVHTYAVGDPGVLVHNKGPRQARRGAIGTGDSGTPNSPGAPKKGSLPDWLKERFNQGKDFDRANRGRYPHNEVEVTVGGNKYIVDSYSPGKEIVSRKGSQLADIKEKSAIEYLNEFARKYPAGAEITDSPFNPAVLRGGRLDGKLIFEVPVQNKPIPQAILDAATEKGITIRDVNGTVYN